MRHRACIVLLVGLFVCVGTRSAEAQSSPWLTEVRVGDRLTVVDTTGRSVSGRVTTVQADRLQLGAWVVTEEQVARAVRNRDSLDNGVLAGAVAGALIGGVGLAIVDFCGWDPCTVTDYLQAGAVVGSMGAVVGALADALNGPRSRVLFERSSRTFTLTPTFGRRGAGVRAAVRW